MHLKTASRLFFAMTMIAIGVIGLLSGSFAPIWQPVPETVPARQALAYMSNILAVGSGAGLLMKRTAALAAFVLLACLLVWTALFKVPFIIRAPLEEVSYQSNGENAVLIAAAWVLYAQYAKAPKFPAGNLGVRIAYILYGLALVALGFSHFVYLNMTAPIVPGWLPDAVFWAYLTGSIYLASGLAVATGLGARQGALAAAMQITLITLLVWGPMLVAGNMSAMHWQETVVSRALTAGAWVMASGSPPARGSLRLPSRRGRSGSLDTRP